MDAERHGVPLDSPCPNCGLAEGKKLDLQALETMAHKYFVWGSLRRFDYGMAPRIQFNQHQKTSIEVAPWLLPDVKLFELLLGVGFFAYGPRLWMVGEVEPLKALQNADTRGAIIERILREYPTINLTPEHLFYRVRVNPMSPAENLEYDSPPSAFLGKGRIDSKDLPVLYGSPDLELCLHECRVTAEDELYVATLAANDTLRLLDLSVILEEQPPVTEFESLDMAVHMLFLAGKHAYDITREIATAASARGFSGLVFPSYFTYLRRGNMPFQTVFGISHRRIPQFRAYEQTRPVQNLAIFGRPLRDRLVSARSIDRVILRSIGYDIHFGPVFK